jgi:hypothetical protein
VNGVAEGLPPVGWPVQVMGADRGGHPVGGDPGQDFGVGEVPAGPAHLPEPVVGLVPGAFQMVHGLVLTPHTASASAAEAEVAGETIPRNSRLRLADPCDQCTNRQCCLYTIGWRGIAFFSTCAFKSSIILSSLRVSQFSQ